MMNSLAVADVGRERWASSDAAGMKKPRIISGRHARRSRKKRMREDYADAMMPRLPIDANIHGRAFHAIYT